MELGQIVRELWRERDDLSEQLHAKGAELERTKGIFLNQIEAMQARLIELDRHVARVDVCSACSLFPHVKSRFVQNETSKADATQHFTAPKV